jgi:hypothetical protein
MSPHAEIMKRLGTFAACVGIVMIVIMAFMFFVIQSLAIVWGYLTTVGIYFVMIGVIVWIVGAAIEYRDQKIQEMKTEQTKSTLPREQ